VIRDRRAYQLLWELVDRIETIEAVREAWSRWSGGKVAPWRM
jgi:hypothetical protein